MNTSRVFKHSVILMSVVSMGALSGCMGGNTYGTGVSQEAQLASDVGGLLLLGGEKKAPIEYSARPKLVKVARAGELPPPAERITSDSAYFPTNPEEKRAARIAALENGEKLEGAAVPRSGYGSAKGQKAHKFHNGDHEESAAEMQRISVQGREERLKRAAEARGIGLGGGAPRKYLTQPPAEYRTPAETAAVGNVGEYEKSEAEKKTKPIIGGWGS